MKPPTLIVVLGMHRSGTSAATRMLNLLGAELGDRLISPQAGVNDKGFWEHEELLCIDEAILSRLGSCWYDLRPLPESWWRLSELEPLRAEARAFVEREFSGRELAALKDPRLCRLLPFWEPVLRDLGWRVKVLMVLRSPSEVSASLCKRDPFTAGAADLLWLRYQMEAERYSSGLSRCFVSFDELLGDWRATAERLAGELEIDWPVGMDDAAAAIASEIDPRMRHQRGEADDGGQPFRAMANRAFELALKGDHARGELDALWQRFEADTAACAEPLETVHQGNTRLVETTRRLQELGEELSVARATLKERDDQISYAVSVVEERDRQLAEVQADLARLGEEHAHALEIVRERDAQLARKQQEYLELATHPFVRIVRKFSRRLN